MAPIPIFSALSRHDRAHVVLLALLACRCERESMAVWGCGYGAGMAHGRHGHICRVSAGNGGAAQHVRMQTLPYPGG